MFVVYFSGNKMFFSEESSYLLVEGKFYFKLHLLHLDHWTVALLLKKREANLIVIKS